LESKSAALVAAVFVDFPKNKRKFSAQKSKHDIVRRVQFFTSGRRPMRSYSAGAVATIAVWKSAPMQRHTMSAARHTSGADVTPVEHVVVVTADDGLWSSDDVTDDVTAAAAGGGDGGDADDCDVMTTPADDVGNWRRCGRIESGLTGGAFDSETPPDSLFYNKCAVPPTVGPEFTRVACHTQLTMRIARRCSATLPPATNRLTDGQTDTASFQYAYRVE